METLGRRADEVDGNASASLQHSELDVLTERSERLVQRVGDALLRVV